MPQMLKKSRIFRKNKLKNEKNFKNKKTLNVECFEKRVLTGF
jgi:hypothetical protein